MTATYPVITTERLLLRMLEESDFEEYAAIHTDPEVTRFTARAHLDRMETWRHLAMIVGAWHLRGFGFWGVFERESGKLVGRVGFWQPDGWPDFELGWTMGRLSWGKGYAPEAARACIDYAFNVMGRDHLISLIDPLNVNSIRVAEKIGETLQDRIHLMGHELLVYGIRK
ncbi:MAG TPA: GNAT family N-acetyltransferase [Thermoanaerobaculia bacterium]|nr:GNAT family N-acetyltransferase [Thermoanaerobaculia bacterium]